MARLHNRPLIRTQAEVAAEIRRSMDSAPLTHTMAWVVAEVDRLHEYAFGPTAKQH